MGKTPCGEPFPIQNGSTPLGLLGEAHLNKGISPLHLAAHPLRGCAELLQSSRHQ